MNATAEQQREWAFLRAAILAVLLLGVLEVVGTVADARLNPGPSALTVTAKCLRNEKRLPVETGAIDPIGKTADGGVARTRIEGNGVTIVISSSVKKAERIAGYYRAVNSGPDDVIELRGHVVYVWEGSPTPTQKQTTYDCHY